ncbi:MAG TPA: TraR/DksA family transcriptional regulator [Candidatus Polarisedimenticolia bacterium]|nr:TraR/DksA family transcriptional regulator [Candidatus Polarisedimenticolia bacterium]
MKAATNKKKTSPRLAGASRTASPKTPRPAPPVAASSRAAAKKTTLKAAKAVAPRPVAPAPKPAPLVSPFNSKQLDTYRRLLQERKKALAEAYNKNKTYGRLTEDEGTQDLADKASSAYTKEFLYSLSNTDREVLNKVDESLVRLEAGAFGLCEECGDEINRKRLEAVPWASHCITCQEKIEKGLL